MRNHLQRQPTSLPRGEERHRTSAENARDVFWLADPTISNLFYVSPSYESVWGQSLEILYRNPSSRLEAIVPQDRPRVLASIQKAATIGYNEEYRILRPAGSTRWIWDRAFPIPDKNGGIDRGPGFAETFTG